MKSRPRFSLPLAWAGCALLGAGFGAEVHGDTVVVAADSQISAHLRHPAGGMPEMRVSNFRFAPESRAFARFDLASLPDHAHIDKAVLRLWVTEVSCGGKVEIVPVLEDWHEWGVTAQAPPLLGTAVGTFDLARGRARRFVSVDVTDLVREWLDGGLANRGLALVGSELDPVCATFSTKEGTLTGHAPELEVAVSSPGVEGPPGPPGPPGPQVACIDGDFLSCYTGPPGTRGVGICLKGERVCQAGAFGGCVGEILPLAESCNGLDDNCNGARDEGADHAGCAPLFPDVDGDGFGDSQSPVACMCPQASGLSANNQDCYDASADVRPGQTAFFAAPRPGGGFDYDCNGIEQPQLSEIVECTFFEGECSGQGGWWGASTTPVAGSVFLVG